MKIKDMTFADLIFQLGMWAMGFALMDTLYKAYPPALLIDTVRHWVK